MGSTAVVVDVAVVASGAAALIAAPRAVRRPPAEATPAAGPVGPGVPLAIVIALIYLNQVLFTVYVIRVHGGDASFIARYLPGGWFATLSDNPTLQEFARHFPAAGLLAPTVLRVQAFLRPPSCVPPPDSSSPQSW
jgi:hypothetical protein